MIAGGYGTPSDAMDLTLILLVLALLLSVARLIRGPSLADRVAALNLMSTLAVGVITTYAIGTDQPVFLDVASILALISFVSTVAFARYIELRRGPTK